MVNWYVLHLCQFSVVVWAKQCPWKVNFTLEFARRGGKFCETKHSELT